MQTIRTTADATAICDDPHLLSRLHLYAASLNEFGDDLQATILVVGIGDTLGAVERACGHRLIEDSRFTLPVEVASRHGQHFEIVGVTSDDGSGFVLFVPDDGDPTLVAACRHALSDIA